MMKTVTQEQERETMQRNRRPPAGAWTRRVGCASKGELEAAPPTGSVELVVEATNADGELSAWFDDFWWVDVLTLYKKRSVTIHVAPTTEAWRHPAVLHQFEMLRRVEPSWKSIAYLPAVEATIDLAGAIASAPFHEVRIIENGSRSSTRSSEAGSSVSSLIEAVKSLQNGTGGRKPALVRVQARDAAVGRIIAAPAG